MYMIAKITQGFNNDEKNMNFNTPATFHNGVVQK